MFFLPFDGFDNWKVFKPTSSTNKTRWVDKGPAAICRKQANDSRGWNRERIERLCNIHHRHHHALLNYTVKFVKMVRNRKFLFALTRIAFEVLRVCLPFELNHGRMAGWFWNKCGYWWIVSLSNWRSAVISRSLSCLKCFFSFFNSFTSRDDSSGDSDRLIGGLGLLVDSQLTLSAFTAIESSSFDFCSWFWFESTCLSLFSSKISQMWKPDDGFVDVGSFMLSRNLWKN